MARTATHTAPRHARDVNSPTARLAIRRIIEQHHLNGDGLITILQSIQDQCGYLSQPVLRTVAEETGSALTDVYAIATFYRSFTLAPRGRHLVCVCLGTACHVNAAPGVLDQLQRELGIQPGQTTPDGQFTLETVNCLGACALGPILVLDGRYYPKVTPAAVRRILSHVVPLGTA